MRENERKWEVLGVLEQNICGPKGQRWPNLTRLFGHLSSKLDTLDTLTCASRPHKSALIRVFQTWWIETEKNREKQSINAGSLRSPRILRAHASPHRKRGGQLHRAHISALPCLACTYPQSWARFHSPVASGAFGRSGQLWLLADGDGRRRRRSLDRQVDYSELVTTSQKMLPMAWAWVVGVFVSLAQGERARRRSLAGEECTGE